MPVVDPLAAPERSGTRYPPPHDARCRDRRWRALGDAAGLTQFGVNLVVLEPGVWSSQRHWHTHEDEFVWVVSGAPTLVTDEGAAVLAPGQGAGFKAGVRDGHHFRNDTAEPVTLLVIGSRSDDDRGGYSDIDMQFLPGRGSGEGGYATRDGRPLDAQAAATLQIMAARGEPTRLADVV